MPDSMPKDMPDRTRRSAYVSFMPEYIWKYLLDCQNKYRKRFARHRCQTECKKIKTIKCWPEDPRAREGPLALVKKRKRHCEVSKRLFLPCIVYELQSKCDETELTLGPARARARLGLSGDLCQLARTWLWTFWFFLDVCFFVGFSMVLEQFFPLSEFGLFVWEFGIDLSSRNGSRSANRMILSKQCKTCAFLQSARLHPPSSSLLYFCLYYFHDYYHYCYYHHYYYHYYHYCYY